MLSISISYGRDKGFAIECSSSNIEIKKILSFIEIGVDKRVRYLETEAQTMWDSHEWENGSVTVNSFIKMKGDAYASLISFIKIDMGSMVGEFVNMSDFTNPVSMQCRRWSPQTRNK